MKRRLLTLLLAAAVHLPGWTQVFGTVDAVSGHVTVQGVDGVAIPAVVGQKIHVGQTVATLADGELHAQTEDHGLIAVRPNSVFTVTRYVASQDTNGVVEMSLLQGALRSISGWIGKLNPRGYRLTAGTATVGIRGTDHETVVLDHEQDGEPAGTYDSVLEGATTLRTAQGEVQVEAGQYAFSGRGGQAAPGLLAQHPRFFLNRLLRLENGIPARKRLLAQRLQKLLARHPKMLERMRERVEGMDADEKKALRQRLKERGHRANEK
ncbi:hypothetical protein [Rhodoferax saidenbachensis]|uniref:FecR protein domain-containing protein n=1 Tax=Rhodoferax saidenbachensis TaxID=1484693 RepID=A0ABU1ZPH4_9BURK|nr:hypothetical protein [Rhodoferax saidenbachensis]MDR7307454.1 hypothetical protein [Rhodoferax saidenbachensis]